MTPSARKALLMLHVTSSVGLFGAIGSFFALAVVGLSASVGRAAGIYSATDLIATYVIFPVALAALAIGVVQALCTPWGLTRHYWVLIKFVTTIFAVAVLWMKMPLIHATAQLAAEANAAAALRLSGLELAVHAGAGFLILLLPMGLSIYKPAGRTRLGWL